MKVNIFLLFFVALFFLIMPVIYAADPLSDFSGVEDNLKSGVDKVENVTQSLSNEETRSEYLMIQLRNVLNKTSFGRSLFEFEKSMQKQDRTFIWIFGVGFSYSFLFFCNILFWVAIVNLFWNMSKSIEYFISFDFTAKLVRNSVFIFLFLVLIFSKLSLYFTNTFLDIFSNQISFMWKVASLIIMLIFIMLTSSYSKIFKRIFSSLIHKREDARKTRKLEKVVTELEEIKRKESLSKKTTEETEDEIYSREYLKELGKRLREDK